MAVERHYMSVMDTRRVLCNCYMQLCVALEKGGVIKCPQPMFGSEEARYAQRFECFKVFPQPVYVPFKVMKERMDAGGAASPVPCRHACMHSCMQQLCASVAKNNAVPCRANNGSGGADVSVEELLEIAKHGFKQVEVRVEAILLAARKQELPLQPWELEDLRLTGIVAKTNWTACNLLKLSFAQIHTFVGSWDLNAHRKFPTLRLKRQ
jgi:hypothetical protein